MSEESRKRKVERVVPNALSWGPSHRLWDKPIHLRVFLIRLYV